MNQRALTATASTAVELPAYDRSKLRVGIVHLGVGGFHRAHQARAVDELLRQGLATEWAICGVGLLEQDRRMAEALHGQEMLYTLVEKAPNGDRSARVIGSIVDYLLAADGAEAVLEQLSHPDVRIVSMTITEGGYNISPVTGEFDLRHHAIVHDLQPGAVPTTMFAFVTESLRRRRDRGVAPFTVMSCDNMQDNGVVARRAILSYAGAVDAELARWIEREVRFPSSMVDRITPATTPEDQIEVSEQFGVDDAWPVVCEPFFQWVLEDAFSSGRPPWEQAGVQVVDDVEPYELMKLRLLNAGHQALAYFGHLSGYHYAHEAAQDPAFARFLLAYMTEAVPTLQPVPGINLDAYQHRLIERLSNAEVKDTIARLGAETSDRIPKFVLPVIRENLAQDRPVRLAAAVVASWARYAEGIDEHGESYPVVDRLADSLTATARTQRQDRTVFIRNRDLFGDLADDPRFVLAYETALDSLFTRGARATVEELAGAVPAG